MAFHSIKKLIHTSAQKDYKNKNLDMMLICNSAERSIAKHCDPATARNASVTGYSKKALTISVSGASYAQDIRIRQRLIIRDLNQEIKEGIVERILYKI